MLYCPPNVSLDHVWVDDGLTRCFFYTVTTSMITGFLFVGALFERLMCHTSSSTIGSSSFRKSYLFTLQVSTSLLLTLLPIAECVVQVYLNYNGVMYGYLVLDTLGKSVVWPFSLYLIHVEKHRLVPASRHGLTLLVFWTAALLAQSLTLLSVGNEDWWFKLKTSSDVIEFSLFVIQFVATFVAFMLGLKAPAIHLVDGVHRSGDLSGTESLLDNDELAGESSNSSSWRKFRSKIEMLLPFLWPRKSRALQIRVLFCCALVAAGRVTNVYVPTLYKRLVDSMTPTDGEIVFRWELVLFFVGIKFFEGLGGVGFLENFRNFLWISVQQYTTRETEVRLFEHLHDLSVRWHVGRKTGEILRVIDRGTDSVTALLSYLVFNILPIAADIIIAIVYFAAAFNPWFSLIMFLTMLAFLTSTVAMMEWRINFKHLMNQEDTKLKGRAVDSLLNFETVKYYGAEKYEVDRYKDVLAKFQYEEWRANASWNLLKMMQNILTTGGLLAGSLLSVYYVSEQEMTVGDFVMFGTYVLQLYTPLNSFHMQYRVIQQSFVDVENMLDIMKEEDEVKDAPGARDFVAKEGVIEFRNVSFGYLSDRPILKNVSFTVPAGKSFALVGLSGGGKSTVIRLLFRLFDVQDGSILLDGQDIRCVTQASIRRAIGVVPQDTVLFNNTIKYNIQYGRFEASDEEICEAAKAADIHDQIVGFPDGYQTMVGERGLKLSGGEKQRIAIARTLLKCPTFVLLDEATSALDTHTERSIQASLAQVCDNRTTLVVAHRLSTIVNADQILVLSDGGIAERGRHEELLALNGLYAEMWKNQVTSEDVEMP